MFYFFIFYLIALYALFISKGIIFFNEEILIAVCMGLVFLFLVSALKKIVNFAFFFRVEYIYFSFLNVIILNIKLIDKMLTLVSLESLRLESLLIYNLYSFFSDFSSNVLSIAKFKNLNFVKNFIFSFISNLYAFNFFSLSFNFYTITLLSNNNLVQEFYLSDTETFTIYRNTSFDLLASCLSSSDLYDVFLEKNFSSSTQDFLITDIYSLLELKTFKKNN